jgi:hypothetical protein
MTTCAREVGALHNARGKDQQVLGAQRFDSLRKVAQQEIGDQCPTTNQQAVEILGWLLDVRLT